MWRKNPTDEILALVQEGMSTFGVRFSRCSPENKIRKVSTVGFGLDEAFSTLLVSGSDSRGIQEI